MRLFRCLRYSIDCKLSFNINQTGNKADGQMLSGTDPFPRHSDQSVVSVSKLQMNYGQPAGQRLWLFRINQPLTSILSLPFISLLNWQRAIFGIVRFNVIMKIGMWRFGDAIFRGGRASHHGLPPSVCWYWVLSTSENAYMRIQITQSVFQMNANVVLNRTRRLCLLLPLIPWGPQSVTDLHAWSLGRLNGWWAQLRPLAVTTINILPL